MATANLTKRAVDALEYTPECDYFVWDTKQKGFGVRVTERLGADGAVHRRKAFVVGYRPKGSRRFRRLTLGVFGPLTVDQARAEAMRQLAAVSSGADPVSARKAITAEETVRAVGVRYMEHVALRRKASTADGYRQLWDARVLPAIGSRKVVEVTTQDIRKLHHALHATPYLANRVVAMLGAFFTFAAKEGSRPLGGNPAHGVEFFPEESRERFLSEEEFRRLGAALQVAEDVGLPAAPQHRRKPGQPEKRKHVPKSAGAPIKANPYVIAAIRLLALTGCREGEVLSLRWDAVDFDTGYLRFADTKTGKSNRPIGASALALLRTVPVIKDNPYVFPGSVDGECLKDIRRTWFAVRQAAKLEGLRLHDIRHSFASVPASGGDSLLVIRSLLGHSRSATTERYAHLGDDPVRTVANRTAGSIDAWLSGKKPKRSPLKPSRNPLRD